MRLRQGRIPAIAAGMLGMIALEAAPASAHGFGGRVDLPVPRWLFLFGAITALVVSFVALGALWSTPKLQHRPLGRVVPLAALWRSPIAAGIFRAIAFIFFVLVVFAAFAGRPESLFNLAPVVVYVWFWVGLACLHAFFGDLWKTLSPFDTLARLIGVGATQRRALPAAFGVWPAAIGLFLFVWLELAAPFAADPRFLGWLFIAYTMVSLTGMTVYGRETWNQRGEVFAVYFSLLARISPFARDEAGTLHLRAWLSGLPSAPAVPGSIAVIMVLLGSTTFDGFSRGTLWQGWTRTMSEGAGALAATAGIVGTIGLVAGAYAGAMAVASRVSGERWHPMAVRFAHTLVPIAFAYVIAHYFSLLFIEGQIGLIVISDPLDMNMNIFGTAYWEVNTAILTPLMVWYVQVAAIVIGHIAGVVLAHDRAIDRYEGSMALRTQYALLAVMVLFTAIGLLILSG